MENFLIRFHDSALQPIWEKVQRAERLSFEDGMQLFRTSDFLALGKMAHFVQKKKSGDAVYFVVNQKIEPTNICVHSCKCCDFSKKRGEPTAYEMSIEEILAKLSNEIQEVHITGGLHPDWDWEYYLEMIRRIRASFPSIGIKAFTAVEIDYFYRKFQLSVEDILKQLKEAGLQALPGGGAEVFSERVRKELFPQKISAERWLDIHRTAHRLGIPTNATLLYGHIETMEERLSHLMKLRELQDETGGFLSFVPLAFQPGASGIKSPDKFTSAIDDLKLIAISRLMLDNFPHIKAYWVMSTEEVASAALNFGADDIDGTVGGERIAHDAGAKSAASLTKERIVSIIREAGKIPVERDLYYTPRILHAENVIGRIPYLNSVPFFECFDQQRFKLLPVTPRRMGFLAEQNQLLAGLFSLCDFLRMKEHLTPLPFCLAARDQVKSVLLFTNDGWSGLEGKTIGVTDATATSIMLLKILLWKKYGIHANFERMSPIINDYTSFDAVLLIGDEALKHQKHGLQGFELVYDLAWEWYEWKRLPFIFALWGIQSTATAEQKEELQKALSESLAKAEGRYAELCAFHTNDLKISEHDCVEYLEGFTFRVGEREQTAITEFEKLLNEVITMEEQEGAYGRRTS
jgi:aminodeoxyfutalosine synthase